LLRDSRRQDGSGKLRYQRKAPTNEFDTEDEAIAYILDFRATGSTKIPCDPLRAVITAPAGSQAGRAARNCSVGSFSLGLRQIATFAGSAARPTIASLFPFSALPARSHDHLLPARRRWHCQCQRRQRDRPYRRRPPLRLACRAAAPAFYIGLFVGPFILVAALTGTLYVLTPQIESHLYAAQLYNQSRRGPAAGRTGEGRAGLLAAGAPVRGAPGQGGMEYPRDVHQPGLATRRAGPSSSIR
jgi:hypothetical protein